MSKIKTIAIKKEDETFTDQIPIGADASNIDMLNGINLQNAMGNIDINVGSVEKQLKDLGEKIVEIQLVDNSLIINTSELGKNP